MCEGSAGLESTGPWRDRRSRVSALPGPLESQDALRLPLFDRQPARVRGGGGGGGAARGGGSGGGGSGGGSEPGAAHRGRVGSISLPLAAATPPAGSKRSSAPLTMTPRWVTCRAAPHGGAPSSRTPLGPSCSLSPLAASRLPCCRTPARLFGLLLAVLCCSRGSAYQLLDGTSLARPLSLSHTLSLSLFYKFCMFVPQSVAAVLGRARCCDAAVRERSGPLLSCQWS